MLLRKCPGSASVVNGFEVAELNSSLRTSSGDGVSVGYSNRDAEFSSFR